MTGLRGGIRMSGPDERAGGGSGADIEAYAVKKLCFCRFVTLRVVGRPSEVMVGDRYKGSRTLVPLSR
jgi:hypothetical protein